MKTSRGFLCVLLVSVFLLVLVPCEVDAQVTERVDIRVRRDSQGVWTFAVSPWLREINDGDSIEWKVVEAGNFDVDFELLDKQGQNRLPPSQTPIDNAGKRRGPFDRTPAQRGRIERYNIRLTITERNADATLLEVILDPDYRVRP